MADIQQSIRLCKYDDVLSDWIAKSTDNSDQKFGKAYWRILAFEASICMFYKIHAMPMQFRKTYILLNCLGFGSLESNACCLFCFNVFDLYVDTKYKIAEIMNKHALGQRPSEIVKRWTLDLVNPHHCQKLKRNFWIMGSARSNTP